MYNLFSDKDILKKTNRFLFYFLMTVTFFMLLGLANNITIFASNLFFVDPLGTDDLNHGTNEGLDAFKTIQYAIDDPRVVDGDIIYVAAGVYNEALNINKGITILGAGADKSILDAQGKLASAVNIITSNDNIKFDGFKVFNSVDESGNHIQINISEGVTGDYVEISNNDIVCSGVEDTGNGIPADLGLYGTGYSDLVFHNNNVSGCKLHGILLERLKGSTNIYLNNFTSSFQNTRLYTIPAIGFRTYKIGDESVTEYEITAKQWVHNNNINANGGSGILFLAPYWEYPGERMGGKYTNIEVSNNSITNIGDYIGFSGTGIQLQSDGPYGGIYNAILKDNVLSPIFPNNESSTHGIRLLGNVMNTEVTGNLLDGFAYSFMQNYSFNQFYEPGCINNLFYNNRVINTKVKIAENEYQGSENILDISRNWWGTTDRVVIQAMVDPNVIFIPYYIDAEMTTLSDVSIITSFNITNQLLPTVINENDNTILVTMSWGTDVTNLTPNIVFVGSSISPLSDVANDFTLPQEYLVTSVDGTTTQTYLVSVVISTDISQCRYGGWRDLGFNNQGACLRYLR